MPKYINEDKTDPYIAVNEAVQCITEFVQKAQNLLANTDTVDTYSADIQKLKIWTLGDML